MSNRIKKSLILFVSIYLLLFPSNSFAEQSETIIPLPTIDQASNLPVSNSQGSTMEFFTAERMNEFWDNNQKLLTIISPWIMIIFAIILVGIVLTMVIRFFVQANKKKNKIRHY